MKTFCAFCPPVEERNIFLYRLRILISCNIRSDERQAKGLATTVLQSVVNDL